MLPRLMISTAAAGVLAVLAAPVLAGGPGPVYEEPAVLAPAPAPVVSTDWTGGYVGGQLGWGGITAESDALAADVEGGGMIGGLTAGYRYDLGTFVVGGEAQYDWADIEIDDGEIDNIDLDESIGSLDTVGRLKLTAGFDAGRALVYGSAGWATASAEIDGDELNDDGWLVGAGVDYLVTDRVTLGGEVMHHRFDDFDDTDIDIEATTVQLKTTFRF